MDSSFWLSQLHPLGTHHSIENGSLKIGDVNVRSNPLLPRKELEFESSLLIVWLCARGDVYGESVSQLFLPISMWVFFHSLDV